MDVCRPALHVLFFPPLIVNNARENDVSRGQKDGDVNARHLDAAVFLDGPPTYAVAGSVGVDAIACACASVSLVRAG